MTEKSKKSLFLFLAGLVVIVTTWLAVFSVRNEEEQSTPAEKRHAERMKREVSKSGETKKVMQAPSETDENTRDETSRVETEEEKREEDEEKRVDAFDSLTDKWMEPAENGVSLEDVAAFSDAFKRVPPRRRDECLHRALNLVPDENVMLLAGMLMDKSLGNEVMETIFSDVLNRDDIVKKPIMEQIFRDKTHPCWTDVAWILDVTGELPKKK